MFKVATMSMLFLSACKSQVSGDLSFADGSDPIMKLLLMRPEMDGSRRVVAALPENESNGVIICQIDQTGQCIPGFPTEEMIPLSPSGGKAFYVSRSGLRLSGPNEPSVFRYGLTSVSAAGVPARRFIQPGGDLGTPAQSGNLPSNDFGAPSQMSGFGAQGVQQFANSVLNQIPLETNGGAATLAQVMQGKEFIFLGISRIGCGPCYDQSRELQNYLQLFQGRCGFATLVLANDLSSRSTQGRLNEWEGYTQNLFRTPLDAEIGSLLNLGNIRSVPRKVILSADGTVIKDGASVGEMQRYCQ